MKSRGRQQFRAEPSSAAKTGGDKAGIAGTDPVGHVYVLAGCRRAINHNCSPATTSVPRRRIFVRLIGGGRAATIAAKQQRERTMPQRASYLAGLTMATAVQLAASQADAQKKYDPGASDTEIRIGNIMPYSGPASSYGVIGKTEAAYFEKINAEGGINGRKIKFISYDDGYSPPKAVEQARKLVESDEVLLIFNPLGTPSNTAIQ